jgi:glycyl-tRNA synthetase alpha subunit
MLKLVGKASKYFGECIAIYDNESGVKLIKDFISVTESLSLKYPTEDDRNLFKGDMLEIFAEIFFQQFASHPAVGIREYTPIPITEDYGVDAIGINVVGDPCVIQVKYRVNPKDIITYEDIAKTYTSGRECHNILLDKKGTVIVFTTANDISHQCKEVLKSKVRVISRGIISGLIDSNSNFWQAANNTIVDTLSC